MSFTFFDHTGDVGVSMRAGSAGSLFEAAADALLEVLTDPAQVDPLPGAGLELVARDLDALLVDWLSELIYLFEAQKLLVRSPRVIVARDEAAQVWRLTATLHGERLDPVRHQIKVLVKAVTWHKLSVEETAGGWRATVIFDI